MKNEGPVNSYQDKKDVYDEKMDNKESYDQENKATISDKNPKSRN